MSSPPSPGPPSTFSRGNIPTATGAANSKPTRCSRPTTSSCTRSARERRSRPPAARAAGEMLRYQNEDGSWSLYPGGPGNISLSVKCYFSAKLMGITADDPRLVEVPRVGPGPRRRGGVQHLHQDVSLRAGPVRLRCGSGHSAGDRSVSATGSTSTSTRSRRGRARFLCRWPSSTPRSRSRKSPASRESMSCLSAAARTRSCACAWTASAGSPGAISSWSWTGSCTWPRRCTFGRCASWRSSTRKKWMLERLEMTDGLGAIYPAMLNAILALRCLGYSEDDPQVIRARDEFEKLGIEQPPRPRTARADLPHAAVHLAGVGYGAGGLCAGRSRRAARTIRA